MPRRNGTGPMGAGSMTGRGLGLCTGANAVKYLSFTAKMTKKYPLAQRYQGLAGFVFCHKIVVYSHLFFVLQNFFNLGLGHNFFT
ncbi:hypothetical protein CLOACE_10930 [Clostridium acetireducens DSM 10703]|jgi:hypothetical protein|uniref:Uncharacterized protein n=1 Tax=Clostridium acetireducens DSM 10703 TaxID=1121290 RepID=A0A1E8EZ69_9CLOT|nr:DUF5320 domain-containing protein [Clostridium acetireducens]OFI06320.1 hypothetical protein CLOACE_10930 [Clostridium acetireducens DSM 10703]